MKYGTYTTIDCPTNKIDKALEYLRKEFGKIGGKVRKVMNPHDFDDYPSFEIDYPEHLEDVDEDEDEKAEEKQEWLDEAMKIEQNYNDKFEKYL